MTIILLIVFAVLVFLVLTEAIPLRKWVYVFHTKVIGMKFRFLVELLNCLDRVNKRQ